MISSPSSSASRSARSSSSGGIVYTRADAASLRARLRSGATAIAATDQQPARLERIAVVGVADHLRKRSIAKREHRPKGSQAGAARRPLPSPAMSPAEPEGRKLIASNRKARHDYSILDTIEAGIVLQGSEVKSLRLGHVQIADAYARVAQRRDLARRRSHRALPLRPRRRRPRSRPIAQAAAARPRDRTHRRRGRPGAPGAGPAVALLQRRQGQSRAGAGAWSPQGRQAQRHGRARCAARHAACARPSSQGPRLIVGVRA